MGTASRCREQDLAGPSARTDRPARTDAETPRRAVEPRSRLPFRAASATCPAEFSSTGFLSASPAAQYVLAQGVARLRLSLRHTRSVAATALPGGKGRKCRTCWLNTF